MATETVKQLEQELEQLKQLLASQSSGGLMVKVNSSGGVYIRHASFVEYSSTKNKEYVAGVNMGYVTAKALFNNPELIEQIRTAVNALK